MRANKSVLQIECAYCLQPFAAPMGKEQEVLCPYCGFRYNPPNSSGGMPDTASGGLTPWKGLSITTDYDQSTYRVAPYTRTGGEPASESPAGDGASARSSGVLLSSEAGDCLRQLEASAQSFPYPPRYPSAASHSFQPRETDHTAGASAPATIVKAFRDKTTASKARGSKYTTLVAVGASCALVGVIFGFWLAQTISPLPFLPFVEKSEHRSASNRGVLVEGRITFRPNPLTGVPDAGAVVIFLPADRKPTKTIPVEGLRTYENLQAFAPGPRAIASLGGTVERTNSTGEFMTVLTPGTYYLLIISAKARRASGAPISPSDLAQMRQYFYAAEDLVGSAKYHWSIHRFEAGKYRIERNLGLDESGRDFDPLENLGNS